MTAAYPLSYISYLSEFHATRDYFECHELLEEYWKAHQGEEFTGTWHGLIQVAVGCYHHRRGNIGGAVKMWTSALQRLTKEHLIQLGLDGEAMLAELKYRRDALANDVAFPYSDMNLPICDPNLKDACLALCANRGWQWGIASEDAGEDVIHRHLTRDRSEVVAARNQAILERGR
ncbi:DUF309 domain-containing protein [Paenibacillus xylaniclasticus]|uniref:DUF309 domain-containing protein n=1 Tax=Paenibacillus xylaniclasticus TaxID=588083 RepID=UPI0013DF74C2|nr:MULTISPECIES: DUF309 domain-containing protein [Paenibacillus]GFN30778.1 hypothetical protein PCURB6_10380 [Paenibacillus curdlanolyticus]